MWRSGRLYFEPSLVGRLERLDRDTPGDLALEEIHGRALVLAEERRDRGVRTHDDPAGARRGAGDVTNTAHDLVRDGRDRLDAPFALAGRTRLGEEMRQARAGAL